jgi:ankyrin repeat protein
LDQAAKAVALRELLRDGGYNSLRLLHGWLGIQLRANSHQGLVGLLPYLLAAALICGSAVLALYDRLARTNYRASVSTEVGCALVLGGLSSVALDRLRLGYTVQFLDFAGLGVLVYSVADLAGLLGVVLLAARGLAFLVEPRAVHPSLQREGHDNQRSGADGVRGLRPRRRPGAPLPWRIAAKTMMGNRARQLWAPIGLVMAAAALLPLIWSFKARPSAPSLYQAAMRGDSAWVERLLIRGIDVNAVEQQAGATPLDIALVTGHADAAEILLAHGAKMSQSSLFAALSSKDPRAVQLLLSRGADVNAVRNGETPLLRAATFTRSVETVRLLLAAGARVNARDRNGQTALHRAAAAGRSDLAKLLLDAGADVNAKDNSGATPLHLVGGLAVSLGGTGSRDVASLLVTYRANVNARSVDGRTPLLRAVAKGDREWAGLLIAAGADVNARGPDGWMPLHYAAAKGHAALVEDLLAAGAAVNARNGDGMTPLQLARGEETTYILRKNGGTA